MDVITANGVTITLAEPAMASGGEARIFVLPPVQGYDIRLLAKIYHAPTTEHHAKLKMMLSAPPRDPMADLNRVSIAWPLEELFNTDEQFVGFLMPHIIGARPIMDFYNPGIRRKICPGFTYRYLHQAARNLVAAVHVLHQRGYVIGDVNESNILVADDAIITLVDTDSFQVPNPDADEPFRCPVGKKHYTPPELMGTSFSGISRKPEHDRFGITSLVFQMLMEGTMPFDGLYTGADDQPDYEERVASGWFPYDGTLSVPMRPKPSAPPYAILDPELRQLFSSCFVGGQSDPPTRPAPEVWRQTLDVSITRLQHCQENPRHVYGNHLSGCPWCHRVSLVGIAYDPFPLVGDPVQVALDPVAFHDGNARRLPPATNPEATTEAPESPVPEPTPETVSPEPEVPPKPAINWLGLIKNTVVTLLIVAGLVAAGVFGYELYHQDQLHKAYTAAMVEARDLRLEQRFDEARDAARQAMAVENRANDPDALALIGVIDSEQQAKQQFDTIMDEAYAQLADNQPDDVLATLTRANAVAGYKNHPDAIRLRTQANQRIQNRETYQTRLTMARRYYTDREYEKALAQIKRAVEIEGYAEHPGAAKLHAIVEAARQRRNTFLLNSLNAADLLKQRQWDQAEAAARQALAVEGFADNPEILALVARIQHLRDLEHKHLALLASVRQDIEAERYDEARQAIQQALSIDGYSTSKDAISLRDRNDELIRRRQRFRELLAEATTLLEQGELLKAESTVNHALNVPGYDQREEATQLLNAIRTTLAQQRAYKQAIDDTELAMFTGDWAAATTAANNALAIPGFADDAAAKRLLAEIKELVKSGAKRLVRLPADLKPLPDAQQPTTDGLAAGSIAAQRLQQAQARSWALPIAVQVATSGITMRLIPAGTFAMGSSDRENNRGPDERQHQVTITQPFYCSAYEITQTEWTRVMGRNPSTYTKGGNNAPVESVSWEDCDAFVKRLARLEGAPEGSYRLLTEAQWEYAARAGTTTPVAYGVQLESTIANHDGRFPYGGGRARKSPDTPTPIGTFTPNAWGLYDMHGNLAEWCNDWYADYPAAAASDPTGPAVGTLHVVRGGSWSSPAKACRSASRAAYGASYRTSAIGLRIIRVIP